jgi:Mg-chelatase subunit ChlI
MNNTATPLSPEAKARIIARIDAKVDADLAVDAYVEKIAAAAEAARARRIAAYDRKNTREPLTLSSYERRLRLGGKF